ncbi:preprotein translocase subunit SecG [Acidobacteriota bacterium]
MGIAEILLTVAHILICVFLILVVLLQSGKGADLAGAFGGGGSQTALGSRGTATLLGKLTTFAAIAFMLTSLSLAIVKSSGGTKSRIGGLKASEKVEEAAGEEATAEPSPATGEVETQEPQDPAGTSEEGSQSGQTEDKAGD